MARENFSPAALEAIYSNMTDEVFLSLIEVSGAGLPQTFYFVNNTEAITRLGQVYDPIRFGLALPSEEGGTMRSVELVVDNINGIMGRAIDLAEGRPSLRLIIVLASDPDLDPPEAGPFDFVMETARYDATIASASLRFTDVVHQRYPQHGYTAAWAPDLFR